MATQMDNQEPQSTSVFRAAIVYGEMGKYLHNREKFEEAKCAYHEAYKNAPDDIKMLIGRSFLHADTSDIDQAVEDATEAIKIDPSNLQALNALANAKYAQTEIEKSIALCYKGLKRRKNPRYFKIGIDRGLACINDTIGENSGDMMTHYLPIIKKYTIDQNVGEPEVKIHTSRISQQRKVTVKSALEVHRNKLMSRVLTRNYLGPLANDKFFTEGLVQDHRLISASKPSSQKLQELANEALQFLKGGQEVLHAQCLYYTIQRKQKYASKHLEEYKKQLMKNERKINQETAQRLINLVEKCKNELRINDMFKKAMQLQHFLDSKSTYIFPEKDDYIDLLYRHIGEGYLSQHRLSYKYSDSYNHRRFAFLVGMHMRRPKTPDSVIANHPQRFIGLKQALKIAMDNLEVVENSYRKCWLYFEIAQLQCALRNYTISKFYAQNCQREAQKLGSHVWWLNGCFDLISSGVQQGNITYVKNITADAYKWVQHTNQSDQIQSFFYHCVKLAEEVAENHGKGEVEKRRNNILNIIDGDLKGEAKVLFNIMWEVPEGRRFSVLPQKKNTTDLSKSTRIKQKQKHISILNVTDPLPTVSNTPIPGKIVFL